MLVPWIRRNAAAGYATTILITALALLLTLRLPGIYARPFFTLLIAAVALSTYFAGWKAGLLSTALSTVAALYYMLPPHDSLSVGSAEDLVRLIGFWTTAGLLIWLGNEIDRHRRAREQVREAERQFDVLRLAGIVGVGEWDLKTGEVNWVVELPALRGLVPDRQFEHWMERVHPDDREIVRERINRAIRATDSYDIEARVYDAQGNVHWISSRAHIIRDKERVPTRAVGIAMDITERKKFQEILRTSDKLAGVGRFAAEIAHEIRNPVEALQGLMYLLKTNPALAESAKRHVQYADSAVAQIAEIANRTLDRFRETPEPVAVRLSALIDDVAALARGKATRKHVKLETRYESEGEVRGFPGELRQVFLNLIGNSLDAVPDGGKITIHVFPSRNWKRLNQVGIRVVVFDNGSGVPPEARGHVFEPFFTTKGEQGVGIGLWITKGVIEKHNGSIRFRTSTDAHRSGTCFSVFLPTELSRPLEKRQRKATPMMLS